ncbi:PDK repeat-containing protein [Owenweeksia hongkongensis DSM 17368]|uniref:PDK repeat-containing protein n=1 Tax=Owenweeksia hongkongensis (strain DSM 17368 / CIP 108786 / JCM 12287 / NRRL B-23963 / UST20020801) TaxID=926562 RepID=G8R2Q0_OWEHD|nr:PKD domain-containing protein [Owenweeksia hongkongensis]AEV31855.1 PDK repeat-containing protein [Owenweeksia hongkongensis DSM 17368]
MKYKYLLFLLTTFQLLVGQTTPCSTVSAPWSEDFESSDWNTGSGFSSNGTIDTCFKRDYQSHFLMKVGPSQLSSSQSGPSGDHTTGSGKYLFSERTTFGIFPDTAKIITPQIDLSALTVPELTFWYHMFGADVNLLEVFVSTNGGVSYISVFAKTGQQQTAKADAWREATINLASYADSTITLKFISYQTSTGVSGDVAIDDIDIHEVPPCPKPQDLVLVGTTNISASLSWQSGGASNWQIEYGPVGFTVGTGTLVSANSNPYVVKGLSRNTDYEFYVRDSCSATDVSAWIGPIEAGTDCLPAIAPYTETFDGAQWTLGTVAAPGNLRPCWYRDETVNYQMVPTNTVTWFYSGPLVDHTTGTGKFLSARVVGVNATPSASGAIESKLIDLSPLTVPELSFWYHMAGMHIDSLRVDIFDGKSWTKEACIVGSQQAAKSDPWEEYVIDMSAYSNDTIKLRFTYYRELTNGSYAWISIDDIDIHEQPTCPKPQDLTIVGLTNTTAVLQWASGGASNWQIEYGPTGFTQGNGTMVNTNSNPFVVNGLSASTTYDFYVRDSCGATDVSAWVGPINGKTDCNPAAAPYTENFDSPQWVVLTFGTGGNLDICWRRNDLVNYQMVPVPSAGAFFSGPIADHTSGTGKFLSGVNRIGSSYGGSLVGYVESKLIDLSPLNVPELSFWYHMFGSGIDSLRIDVFDGQAWNRGGVIVGQQQLSQSAPWEEYLIDLSYYANDTIKLKFSYYQKIVAGAPISIDDIDIHEQPTCPRPSNLSVAAKGLDSITLSWTSGGANNWNIEYGTSGFALGTGTRVLANTNPFIINGLNSSTSYDFYVRDICSTTDTSLWVGPISVSTDCLPLLAPFTENFDGSQWGRGIGMDDTGTVGQCWVRTPLVDYFWNPGPKVSSGNLTGPAADHTSGNGNFIHAESSMFSVGSGSFSAFIESPSIDLSALINPELSFWYHMFGPNIGTLAVQVDKGNGYTQVWSKSGEQQYSDIDAWKEAVVDLSAYANDTVRVRFVADKLGSGSFADVAIDDVDIHEGPSCPNPQDLVVVGTTNYSVTLQWTTGGASNWNIEYGPSGFTPGSGTIVNAASNPFTITGLTANTGYKFYLGDSCGLADVSEWIGPVRDTTDCIPVLAPYLETFDGNSWIIPNTTYVAGKIDPCWKQDNSVNYVWGARQMVSTFFTGPSVDHTSGTGKFLHAQNNLGTADQSKSGTVVSPIINTIPLNTPELSFWYHMFGAGIDSLVIEVFDGYNWSREFALVGQQQVSKADAWKEATVDISAYANDFIKVRFIGYRTTTSALNAVIAIDDLSVHEQPTCPKPSNLVTTGATASSVTLGWTSGGTSGWLIEYGPSGFTQGAGTLVVANTNPFTITGLASSTAYDFYVRDSCGAGNLSAWASANQTTLVCPSIGASFANINSWLRVDFNSGSTTNADSLYWDFGDGSNSSAINPNHLYGMPGTYTVAMNAFSDCGDTTVVFDTIQVCDTLKADFSQTPIADSIRFDASSSTNATFFKWKIDGTDTTGTSITFKFTSSGTKTVTLTAFNDCGDSVTVSKNIIACAPALASWTYNIISTTGAGMNVQFDGSASANAVSYDWDFGDGNTGTGVNPIHTYITPGLTYLVKLTVKNACGTSHTKAFKLNQIGLEEIKAIKSIKIYPNPVNDQLNLVWDNSELSIKEIQINDISGKKVLNQSTTGIESGKLKIDVNHLPDGQYIINVEGSAGEFWQKKIIIE